MSLIYMVLIYIDFVFPEKTLYQDWILMPLLVKEDDINSSDAVNERILLTQMMIINYCYLYKEYHSIAIFLLSFLNDFFSDSIS